MEQDFEERVLKVAVVGDIAVGKTSLLQRFSTGTFGNYVSSTAASFVKKSFQVNGMQFRLQMWDTVGQEKFRSICSLYYRSAQYVLCVFDCTRNESLQDIRTYWIDELRKNGKDNAVLFLVGNKTDCER